MISLSCSAWYERRSSLEPGDSAIRVRIPYIPVAAIKHHGQKYFKKGRVPFAFGLAFQTVLWGWLIMAGREAGGQSRKLTAIEKQRVESELGTRPGCDVSKLTPRMLFL